MHNPDPANIDNFVCQNFLVSAKRTVMRNFLLLFMAMKQRTVDGNATKIGEKRRGFGEKVRDFEEEN